MRTVLLENMLQITLNTQGTTKFKMLSLLKRAVRNLFSNLKMVDININEESNYNSNLFEFEVNSKNVNIFLDMRILMMYI